MGSLPLSKMASGVTVKDECVEKYNSIKMKKTAKMMVFKIDDGLKFIEYEKEVPPEATWEECVKLLPDNEPRYGLLDMEYTSDDGRPQNKLCFVFWSPDDKVKVKQKMLYASSKDAIKKKFPGIMKELQANGPEDIEEEHVIGLMKK